MSQPSHKIKLETLIGVFLGILILYIAMAFALDYFEEIHFLNKFSGTIESIFSSLAFAGLLYTIYQQQVTIQTQVNEMRESRKQAIKANEIFKQQTELLELQDLKTGFFRHYDESYRFLMSIEGKDGATTYFRHEYIRNLVDNFYRDFDKFDESGPRNERQKFYEHKRDEFLIDELHSFFNRHENSKKFYAILLPYLKSIVLNVEYHLSKKQNSSYNVSYYQTALRFSIEPDAAKLICFIYLWSDGNRYPDFFDVINELGLWVHFNHSSQEIDIPIRNKLKTDLQDQKTKDIFI